MALMSSKINVIIILNALFNVIPIVKTSRADLGTYLHIAPAVEEKTHEELYVLAFINYTYMDDGREVFYSEEKGRYGEGKILNVQGYLEHITSADDVNDHTGCTTNIRGTNGNPLPPLSSYTTANNGGGGISAKPWIALIRRGKCTFEEKIKYAWKHGAVGVIVYNEIPAVSLEKMKIIEKERNITAIFTYKWIGEELGRIVDSGNHIWVSISEGQRGLKPQHNINKTSVLFVSISFIVLMIISLVWLIFYYIQRFRYLQSKDQHSRHLCAVAKRVIMKIPTKSGKNNDDKDSENDCCAICIEPYKATDCIRVLPCNHEFHKNCIDPWLLEHRTCPMCKLDVLKHYGFVVGDPYQKLSSSSNNLMQNSMASHDQIRNNNNNNNNNNSGSSSNNSNNSASNSSNSSSSSSSISSNNSNNSNIAVVINSSNNSNNSSNNSNNCILTSVVVSNGYCNDVVNTNDFIHGNNNNNSNNNGTNTSINSTVTVCSTGSRQVTDV